MMAAKTHSIKEFYHIDYQVVAVEEKRIEYQAHVWQVPTMKGNAQSTHHKGNEVAQLQQNIRETFYAVDIGITAI